MTRNLVSLLALAYLALHPALGVPGPGPASSQAQAQAQAHLGRPSFGSERYVNQQVWRVDWREVDEVTKSEILRAIELLNLDIWRSTPHALDLRLPTSQTHLLDAFLPANTPAGVLIPDVQHLVDLSSLSAAPESAHEVDETWDVADLSTAFHDGYHPLRDMYAFGEALVVGFPGVVEGFEVGRSAEGRAIRGWRAHIANGTGEQSRRGKGVREGNEILEIIIQAGQHAREWVGPSTALYFLHALLLDARHDPAGEVARLLRAFTFTIIPSVNPDGFEYSRVHSRMWRKNRQDTGVKSCAGIDLNSNWGYKWRPGRASACSDSYTGKSAFEAFETRAMANYLANGTNWCPDGSGEPPVEGRRVRAFVDLHSYGQLFMFPFAHSCDDFPPDAEMLMEAGLGVAKAMRTQQGEGYQAGQACGLTYRAPGDAIDYSYGVADVRWSYSAELRDTGTYGFLLPAHLIRPTAKEVTAGLLYLAKFIHTAEIAG